MAGNGPPPKDPALRRRRNAPTRGDWLDIPPESGLKAPALPKRARGTGPWSPSTRSAWIAWWRDGAATQWGSADRAAAMQLARLFEELERGELRLAAEVRLRMDGLGLTAKGKRDLRWRFFDEDAQVDVGMSGPPAGVTRIDERRARLIANDAP